MKVRVILRDIGERDGGKVFVAAAASLAGAAEKLTALHGRPVSVLGEEVDASVTLLVEGVACYLAVLVEVAS